MTGRITEYNKKVPASIREYIDERVADDRIPTISGLCKKINRSRSTIYSWKDKYVEVADLIEEILESQEEMLIDHGLSGKYNPSITKLLLTHHGYSDKVDQSLSGGDTPIKIEAIERVIVDPKNTDC